MVCVRAQGLACNSDDAEHFLKFRHTPMTSPQAVDKDKTIIFLSSSSDAVENKSDSDSARNSSGTHDGHDV
jgi:hypothetical protein